MDKSAVHDDAKQVELVKIRQVYEEHNGAGFVKTFTMFAIWDILFLVMKDLVTSCAGL